MKGITGKLLVLVVALFIVWGLPVCAASAEEQEPPAEIEAQADEVENADDLEPPEAAGETDHDAPIDEPLDSDISDSQNAVQSAVPAAFAVTAAATDSVSIDNEAAFAAWLESHKNSGGRVALGGTVVITSEIDLTGGSGHLTVEAGEYGLVYNGGAIKPGDCVLEITGEGVDVPVLDIVNTGDVYENWNLFTQPLRITANGRDGLGGIALRAWDDRFWYLANTLDFEREGLIRSYGEGAIGLYLADYIGVYCFQIEVDGENSVAVYAEDKANLYFCKLRARGAGAATVVGFDEISLNNCAVSPAPDSEHVRTADQHIVGVNGFGFYCPVPQNAETFSVKVLYEFLLSGEGDDSIFRKFVIEWDGALDEIDTGVLGETVIPGRLPPPFRGLGLEANFPLALVVDVREPSLPCISGSKTTNVIRVGNYTHFYFWQNYDPAVEGLILWRSMDGGTNWSDVTGAPEIYWLWDGGGFEFFHEDIDAPILFQLEVSGAGKSNIVTLTIAEDIPSSGDRDYGDRIVNTKPGNSYPSEPDTVPPSGNNDPSEPDTAPPSGNGGRSLQSGSSARDRSTETANSPKIPKAEPPASTAASTTASTAVNKAAKSEAETADPAEWESDSVVALSFRRLAAMIVANPTAVTFIKNNIQITVPSGELLALGLDRPGLLIVTIEKLPGNSFSVSFLEGNSEILLPFTAYIGDGLFDDLPLETAIFWDARGERLSAVYDSAAGRLAVSCPGPGTFSLEAGISVPTASAADVRADLVDPPAMAVPKTSNWQAEEPAAAHSLPGVLAASVLCLCAAVPAGRYIWIKKRSIKR